MWRERPSFQQKLTIPLPLLHIDLIHTKVLVYLCFLPAPVLFCVSGQPFHPRSLNQSLSLEPFRNSAIVIYDNIPSAAETTAKLKPGLISETPKKP